MRLNLAAEKGYHLTLVAQNEITLLDVFVGGTCSRKKFD